ncbi:hypothetical protein QCA50_020368 [Cerrena zonata]|uniref:Uncharacterized protein n=1 Tax=Cerrena zonata TaxID=2478898 RepID=A0AAW0F9N2_9APHY
MANLPADIDITIWTKYFIPTCIDILGEHHAPFFPTDADVLKSIAKAFRVCFPGLAHEITIGSMIFKVLSQRCCEWRNKCSATAQDNVTEFLDGTPGLETPEARAEYIEGLGVGSTCDYLYQQITPVRRGCFRSDFVLKTFAFHLNAIEGTIRDSPYPAIGALGIAAIAVFHHLTLFRLDSHSEYRLNVPSSSMKPVRSRSLMAGVTITPSSSLRQAGATHATR